jgi:F-type H+-transporting ATPase subunit a
MLELFKHLEDGNLLDFYLFQLPLPPLDLSPSRVVIAIWVAGLLTFLLIWKASKGNPMRPSGISNFFEVILLYFRDEVILPNMGKEGLRWMPFLVTGFFFILFMNLLGLAPPPFGQTATGNILVTATLAGVAFVVIQLVGITKYGFWHHWRNYMPPVPLFLVPLMLVVEGLGVIMKPFALCVRLFANMTAGHCLILGFMSLIFLAGQSLPLLASVPISLVTLCALVAIFLLETLVAFIQAFVFVFLTAVFMGQTMHASH